MFTQLARDRYSVRKFEDRPVSQAHLDAVLAAGQVAPTAVNFQPQRILVLQEPDQLGLLAQATRFHFNAPCALIICCDTSRSWKRKFDGKDSGEIDAAIVTTHMMLQAHELGLGTTWVMYFDPEKLRALYSIPEGYTPVAILPMGYPAADAKPDPLHDKSLPLEETVFYGQF